MVTLTVQIKAWTRTSHPANTDQAQASIESMIHGRSMTVRTCAGINWLYEACSNQECTVGTRVHNHRAGFYAIEEN